MKRLATFFKWIINNIIISIRWLLNIISIPFNRVHRAPIKDLIISTAAGIAFIVAAFMSLNIQWEPPFDAFSNYIFWGTTAIGLVLLVFSLVGFIK